MFTMDDNIGRPLCEFFILITSLILFNRRYWITIIIIWGVYRTIRYYFSDFLYRAVVTLPRDISGILLLLRVKKDINRQLKKNQPLYDIFLDVVNKCPEKTAIIDIQRDVSWTFVELNQLANRFAHFFSQQGIQAGDVVALFMSNCPEFVAVWIGLSKLGVISAWINYNLRRDLLGHSIRTSNSKAIICTEDLHYALLDSKSMNCISDSMLIFVQDTPFCVNLASFPNNEPDTKAIVGFKSVHFFRIYLRQLFLGILCYIYTSGTTGLPKAAVMKHFRALYGVEMQMNKTPWKRRPFSRFSVSQYIGEICRYLLAQSTTTAETEHRVRLMYGNGLRPEIWTEFVRRFRIERIGEVYGSTEGNSNIVNTDNHVGACGFFPIYSILSQFHPLRLVKVDENTGQLFKDEQGLCVPCRPGEIGEMCCSIRRSDPMCDFVGYINEVDTDKKVIRDVFKKGDHVFLSGSRWLGDSDPICSHKGDILYWDRFGYLYFKDRRGDTFRWKGENVSTTQVEGVLQPIKSVVDATVYGVEIPGMEGRAGMAAMKRDQNSNIDQDTFLKLVGAEVQANLPSYARPVFIRLVEKVERTGEYSVNIIPFTASYSSGTFKLKKINLQRQGFNVNGNGLDSDAVFYWNAEKKAYQLLDVNLLHRINERSYTAF